MRDLPQTLPAAARVCTLGAVATMAACATPDPGPLYEPDRRPAIFVNFAPRDPTPDNPWGYQRDWLRQDRAEQWMRSQLSRGDRIIIRTPFGNGVEGWVTSKQWHVAQEWRRRLFIRVINEWLAEAPGRTFSLYIGTLVGNPHDRDMTDARSPAPDDWAAMESFLATVRPWLGATRVHRLWLDHSSNPPENRANVVRLARWCREHLDLVVGMEALPRHGAELDVETMRQVPTLATWRFAETFNKPGTWTVPEGCEALLVVIPQKRAPTPTAEALQAYRRRGFVVSSGHHEYDRLVREVNATEPGDEP